MNWDYLRKNRSLIKIKFNNNDNLNSNIKKHSSKSEQNIAKLDSKIKFITKYFPFPINQSIKNTYNINFRVEKNIQVKQIPYFKIQKSPHQNDNNLNEQFILKKRKRLIKNKKLVFIQFDSRTEQDDEKNYEKKRIKSPKSFNIENYKEIFKRNAKSRSSIYRGVSKNGKHWQVLIMINKKKKYFGCFSKEEEAARVYDKIALQHHGNKAKTNYDYTNEELEKIMSEKNQNPNK